MRVWRSRDRRWRVEQRGDQVKVFVGGGLRWEGPVRRLAEWLKGQGNPVDEWVED